jgi:hypothetical protein
MSVLLGFKTIISMTGKDYDNDDYNNDANYGFPLYIKHLRYIVKD